jgi:hypothetical protein
MGLDRWLGIERDSLKDLERIVNDRVTIYFKNH